MIHKYKMNGMNIVLDVNSGAVHIVEDIVYDILDVLLEPSNTELAQKLENKYGKDKFEEALQEIMELKDEGLLFSEDTYKDAVLSKKNDFQIKAICLNIAHDCNIRCGYCFASTGDYHGGRKLMPLDVAKRAIDFLLENSGSRKRLEVDFFGGEPMMNFDVVKSTIEYGREQARQHNKSIGFTMTTNATLLDDESIEYLNENMDNVVLSIDGRKYINDNMRKTINNKGTYDIILSKIKKFVEKRGDKSHYIRGTFTAYNLDFANDVLALADEGFKEISIEPVVASPEMDYALKEEHLDRIKEEYEKLAKKMIEYDKSGKPFKFYHYLIDLDGGPCVYKKVSSCGAGHEYFAVTPDGDLYPCHQFVGRDGYIMGNVFSGIENRELQKNFSSNSVYHKEKCGECWAKFYCSGGCQANADAFNKDLKVPYELECKMQRKRIECAIMLKAHYSTIDN
ncbi:MAG: thioether cross-link-forming SCIFF peptide maturase [Lutispora sp.]|jgi:uncharacterized protein|uniref:thioether cross-link-forming SCIFF peptide maturase n=1 Tax=Lutispora sp. TaxID=2828727 RepID=UPI003568BE98